MSGLEQIGPTVRSTLAQAYLSRGAGNANAGAALLAHDLMRGDPAAFKVGYSKENAVLAALEVFPEASAAEVERYMNLEVEEVPEQAEMDDFWAELERMGAVTIAVNYSGSGDEGWLQEVSVLGGDGRELARGTEYGGGLNDDGILADVERESEKLVEEHHPGYEINEGGGGTITFTVATRQITFERWDTVETQESRPTLVIDATGAVVEGETP